MATPPSSPPMAAPASAPPPDPLSPYAPPTSASISSPAPTPASTAPPPTAFTEVTPPACRTVTHASISDSLPFETSPGTRALILPEPADPTSLNELPALLNLGAPDSIPWLRTLTWLLCAFRPQGPYPI